MNKQIFDYEYESLKKGERQYMYEDFSVSKIVDAKYVPAEFCIDKGNPFIEALPSPRTKAEIKSAYSVPIPFDRERTKKRDIDSQRREIVNLQQLRVYLPYQKELEESFYNALISAYRDKEFIFDFENPIEVTIKNKKEYIPGKLIGDVTNGSVTGFSLVGYSGTGKTSSLKRLLNHYPQVIFHYPNIGPVTRFAQIVYLVVNCPAHSNFTALYSSIGEAIDNALGNNIPMYQEEIDKTKGLGPKSVKIMSLLKRFCVGCLIFDEIQNIDFDSSHEKSFENLLVMTNETKTAIGIIGTEEAKAEMMKTTRIKRRVGADIRCNTYCQNKKHFGYTVNELFKYQWFDEDVKVTDEIVDSLYETSRGIIAHLILIYMEMQRIYLKTKPKPRIDAKFINKIANERFEDLQELLKDVDRVRNAEKITKEQEQAKEAAKSKSKEETMDEIKNPGIILQQHMKNNVIHNITIFSDDYSVEQISNAFDKVYFVEDNRLLTEKELTRAILQHLQELQEKPRKKKKEKNVNTPSHKERVEYLSKKN